MELVCDECGRKYRTPRGLELHMADKHPAPADRFGPVAEATEQSIDAASHLTEADRGAVEVLRVLASKIDAMGDPDPEWDEEGEGQPFDNVTIPTYLKYANELLLTPASRLKIPKAKDAKGSKLAQLRSIQGGRAS